MSFSTFRALKPAKSNLDIEQEKNNVKNHLPTPWSLMKKAFPKSARNYRKYKK